MASAQLQLIETDHAWKLDRRTVEIGRAGVARARAALAAANTTADAAPAAAPDAGRGRSDRGPVHRAAA